MSFYYIEKENLKLIFEIVYIHYSHKEEVPSYEKELAGMDKLSGILDGVKSNLYPTIFEKATHLFVQINKGHFFSNGNKRLALALTVAFLILNNKIFYSFSTDKYKKMLQKLFPPYKELHHEKDFKPEEYGMYNLSIAVADSHKYVGNDFDLLKDKVRAFLEFATKN